MDDLTSGYNIAEILTLEPGFMNMLGFTYEETEVYLRYVLDKYSTGQDRYNEIWQLIVSNYDGTVSALMETGYSMLPFLLIFSRNLQPMRVVFLMNWWMKICERILIGFVGLLFH